MHLILKYQFFIIALIHLILGSIVVYKNPKRAVNLAFFLMSFSFCTWIVSLYFLLYVPPEVYLLLRGRLVFTAVIFLPANIFHFSLAFPNRKINIKKIALLYSIPFLLLPATLTPLVISEVKVFEWGLEPVPGLIYPLVLLYFLGYFISSIVVFVKKYMKSLALEKVQMLYVIVGFAFFIVFATTTNLILPVLGFKNVYELGPWGSVVMMSFILYSILRYRLMDIELVIKRTTIYLTLVGVITGLYIFALLLPQRLVGSPGNPGSVVFIVVAALIIALTIQPLREWLDSVTDRIFYQRKYDYYRVLERLSRELNSVFKLEEVIDIVSRSLLNEMHLQKVAIFLREKAGASVFICHKVDGILDSPFPDHVEENNPLTEYLIEKKGIVETGEFKHQYEQLLTTDDEKVAILKELEEKFQADLVVPLIQKKNLIGFMILGRKRSGDLFTGRDIALLETLSSQMATALENVNLYQQMLNNERLTIIGTMSAGIAHEIRNPLASIKTFIQMLPDKYDRPEFRKRFDEIVPSEIERLSGITADLLTFSKPSSPSLETVSIPQTIDRIKGLLASPLRKKQITIEADLENLPMVQVDPQQIFQVFLNIFLNGIQASKEKGSLKVNGEVKDQVPGKPMSDKGYMLITISDQGVGIKRKDLSNIFQPFFTTKSEGTGLGLATCKRIIEAHQGDIYVESEEGKGTKVTVMLPTNLTPDLIKP